MANYLFGNAKDVDVHAELTILHSGLVLMPDPHSNQDDSHAAV